MKQGTVKFSKEFRMLSGNVWLGIENEYDMNTQDPLEVFKKAEETVNQFAKMSGLVFTIESIPPAPPTEIPSIKVERTSEDARIAELIRDIYACTELEGDNGLYTWRTLAATCPEASAAYDVMLNSLSNK